MKLVQWPLMDRLLHFVQRWGEWAGPQPAQAPPRCTKCNSPPINSQCTNHRIAVTAMLYNGPLIIGFNVLIKGLRAIKLSVSRWKKWRNGPYYSEMLFRTKSHQRPNVTLKCIYFLCTFRIVNFLYVSYFDLEWPHTFKSQRLQAMYEFL